MKTTSWDRIVSSAPLNKDAALARDGRGENYEPNCRINPGSAHSDTPLPTIRFGGGGENLTNVKFGRMTVIGVAKDTRQNDRGRAWVVRCACGNYEHRRTKAIRNTANANDCCTKCRHLEYLKRRDREGYTQGGSR